MKLINSSFMNDGMPLDEQVEHINFSPLLPNEKQLQKIYNFSLRPETKDNRSSIYFYAKLQNGLIRVKQFFYDWAFPFIYADTNLVKQGNPFIINNRVGFIGIDYKNNKALSYSVGFTTIEISVFEGDATDEELLEFLANLMEINRDLSKKFFATVSYTARYDRGKWGEDEVTRVEWFTSERMNSFSETLLDYKLDSIGIGKEINEVQLLYRQKENLTDGCWISIAPQSLEQDLPKTVGRNIGIRQKWRFRLLKISYENRKIEVYYGVQETKYPARWFWFNFDNKTIQCHIRSSVYETSSLVREILIKILFTWPLDRLVISK
ncbi:hypothetical protein B1B04_04615 [Lysinibacillus sp. KCTC 33748]|uniref:hypothetical protein n=2 Tax=Lysinibacillus TaxID=400634 RepID=UPI0009A6FB5F|nr:MULTISPECIES: hypothetical protein [unclassified Lysinibacillus]OXS76270.1 hypothetical protein B1B04_04615 [Lysinibacillus sp. KCTC 33748]